MAIIIYTREECSRCQLVKRYLDRYNLEYIEEDFDRHRESLFNIKSTMLPIVKINGKFIEIDSVRDLDDKLREFGLIK